MDGLNAIQNLYDTDGLLDILLGVEEYFDNMDLYAYKNWIKGEVVEGPIVTPYFVTITIKFTEDIYPDPVGATILQKQGTIIKVKKDVQIQPISHPRSMEDMDSLTTSSGVVSRPKEESVNVLLYKFQIPRRLVNPESFDEYRLMVSDFNSNPNLEETNQEPVQQENDDIDLDELAV